MAMTEIPPPSRFMLRPWAAMASKVGCMLPRWLMARIGTTTMAMIIRTPWIRSVQHTARKPPRKV